MFFGSFLAFGTIWFWILAVAFVCIMIACSEKESIGGGIFAAICFTTLYFLFGAGVAVFKWIIANPFLSLGIVVGYIVAGFLYMFLKWLSFTRGVRRKYKIKREEFLSSWSVIGNVMPDSLKKEWNKKLTEDERRMLDGFHPNRYKQRLVDWMLFWPFSALWTVLNDPLRRLGEWIVEQFNGVLAQIGKSASRGFEKDK